jgi:serine phosphatase RsbU (regulator of sigma subunit)
MMVAKEQDLQDDDLVFAEEDAGSGKGGPKAIGQNPWKILLVDDEPEIHTVTRMALSDFTYRDRPMLFLSAHSGTEARALLRAHPDIALVFLDVVMETDDAGLQFVQFVRSEVGNKNVRIILRTGQPGMAPEKQIVKNYDIDDYRLKTELTMVQLQTAIVSSLRAYSEIDRIEKIVEARTAELHKMNEALYRKNRDMLDSIAYASRIQKAILPHHELMHSVIPQFFVLYEPKQIVSGDFYWFYNRGHEMLLAVVDCTGHGVPGAFLSVLAYSLLNQIVALSKSLEPQAILVELSARVQDTLKRQSHYADSTDGMDVALVHINLQTNECAFAGARRPMFLFRRSGGFERLDGSRASVGGREMEPYSQYNIQLYTGDTLYLFTDGIADQFGGDKGRKLSTRRFKDTLAQLQPFPLDDHYTHIKDLFTNWQGTNEQTDDILVLGMRVGTV